MKYMMTMRFRGREVVVGNCSDLDEKSPEPFFKVDDGRTNLTVLKLGTRYI